MLYLCYSSYRKRPRNDEGEKELINISSDDDLSQNGDDDAPVQKSQCSAAAAVKANVQPPAQATVSVNFLPEWIGESVTAVSTELRIYIENLC
jgi:hypothetical protein